MAKDPITQAQGIKLKSPKNKLVELSRPGGNIFVPESDVAKYLERDGYKRAKGNKKQVEAPTDEGGNDGDGDELTAEGIRKMKAKALQDVVTEFELELNLDEFPNIGEKREAVIKSLELE